MIVDQNRDPIDVDTLREQCFDTVKDQGELTADEIAAALNRSVLAIRPRISELKHDGRLEPTGQRRPNLSGRSANVWRVAA